MVLNARFDGKVIVPDEPLNLPANQRVRISVEPIEKTEDGVRRKVDLSKLLGIGLGPINPNPRFPDEDSLWESTAGNYLENGPNKPSMKKPAK